MGVKSLNRYLKDYCSKKSIKKVHLSNFKNKTIVIDASIYLYKYVGKNSLIENMYLLISVLNSYNIKPIFVFDGKPPQEKMELLYQRNLDKLEAEEKYNEIEKKLQNTQNEENRDELIAEMEYLRKQFIRIKDSDIQKVKNLLEYYGVTYYVSKSEADQLCAYLINNDVGWACMSDDMDMLMYGCKRIMRHISLMNHTVILYDTTSILKEMKMELQSFRKIMVLSGTDYNIESKFTLDDSTKWFQKYSTYIMDTPNEVEKKEFYQWLSEQEDIDIEKNQLVKICSMYEINDVSIEKKSKKSISKINMEKLCELLSLEGFIFMTQ